MKKHILISTAMFGLLFLTLFPMAAIQGSVTHVSSDTTSHNDITIDGTIGADWDDGYMMHYYDASDDGPGWAGTDWQLNDLYVAVNDTGIAFGMNSTRLDSSNGWLLFLDTDMGASGNADFDVDGANIPWDKRPYEFVNGFLPDHMFGAWGHNMSWDAGGEEYYYWTLFNTTASGDPIDPANGWKGRALNQSATSGASEIHNEGFVEWALLYPSLNATNPVPMNAELRFVAAFTGGDGAGLFDVIPNMYEHSENIISNYLTIHLDKDGDMKPALETAPMVIWTGLDADDSAGGVGVVGLPLGVQVDVYNGMNEYSNYTNNPSVSYRIFEVGGSVTSEMDMKMLHEAGDYNGANDIYRAFLDTTTLADGDILEWYITVPNGTYTPVVLGKHNVTLGPMPPIDIDWVGTPLPSGGFIDPDTAFEVTIQIKQLFNGTSSAQGDVWGTDLTLRYETTSAPGTWVNVSYDEGVAAGSDNTEFTFSMPGFAESVNLTYYVLIENNNTVATANFTLMSGYAPPESPVFSMADPSGDEFLGYPSADAFNGLTEGLFDLLYFNVTGSTFFTTFHFKLRDSFDPGWGKGYWCHPLFNVYVDTAAGGSTASVASASVVIDPDHAWEYGFQVAGWIQAIHYADGTMNDAAGISQSYSDAGGAYWWNFTVPTSLTGVAQANWNYSVLIGSNDNNNFRNRKAAAEEWAFGGGHDGDADPRYIDILVPSGGDSAALQEFITNSYAVSTDTQVTVLAVGKDITFVNDTTNPVVSITSPANGATITGGSVTLTWTVSDPSDATFSGLDRIEVFVDGVLQTSITLGATSASLTGLTNGSHTIRINAYDVSGNVGSAEITITTLVAAATTTTTTKAGTPGFEFLTILAFLGVALFIKRRR